MYRFFLCLLLIVGILFLSSCTKEGSRMIYDDSDKKAEDIDVLFDSQVIGIYMSEEQ